MKRTSLLLTIVALLTPLFMHAQVGAVGRTATAVLPFDVNLGLKAGANFQHLEGGAWDEGYRTGFVGGLFGGVNFKKFGVQGELLFSQMRYVSSNGNLFTAAAKVGNTSIFTDSASAKTGEGNFVVSTLNIPVLLNIKVLKVAWLQLGPQYTGVISVNDKNSFVKEAGSLFKSGDISGVAGLQVNLPMGLHAGARYIIGFSDMNNTNFSDNWRNRSIQLHVGYSFL